MRVLLLRPDNAGDAVKTLPALRQAIRIWPDLRFAVLASPVNYSLFEYEPGIDLFRLAENWREAPEQALHQALRGATFQTAVCLPADRFADIDSLLLASPAVKKFAGYRATPGFSAVGRDEAQNVATLLCLALERKPVLDSLTTATAPTLTAQDRAEAQTKMGTRPSDGGRWIGVCPFGSSSDRHLSKVTGQRLLKRMSRVSGIDRVVLFAGPGQEEAARAMLPFDASKVALCSPSSFRTLAAYFEPLDGVIGVDSGPLHLARALQKPHFGILRGGDSERWFAGTHPRSFLIKRGILSRFPTRWEITWGLDRWLGML